MARGTKQKAIAGGIGIILLILALWFGIKPNSNSGEALTVQQSYIVAITGQDEVFWTEDDGVYHLCPNSSYISKASQAEATYGGPVSAAISNNKRAPTDRTIEIEASECGFEYFTREDYEAALASILGDDDAN